MRDESYKELSVTIYDVTGRLVKQWNNPTIQQSSYIIWDGTDDVGRTVPAGVYFVQLKNAGTFIRKKVVMLR
jgi:flagellar hook assembly protein FlgD